MLSSKKIKIAESNVATYLQEGLLKKVNNKVALKVYVNNSKNSLIAANVLYEKNIYLWAIVTSYYSMFYMANAVLLNLGYKIGDKIVHKVTADCLIAIVRNKLKKKLIEEYHSLKNEVMNITKTTSDELIEFYDFERNKRNQIQYETSELNLKSKALTSIKRSQEFVFEIESLLV